MSTSNWREEPISSKHDRKSFDCGDVALNEFLQKYARKAHEESASKTFVAVDASDDVTVFGYYTLTPAHVEFAQVPAGVRLSGGRHDVGGYKLCRLAVSTRLQGQGLGGQLLLLALRRSMHISEQIGGSILLIDAKNERVADWYSKHGAVPLRSSPLSLLIPFALYRATFVKAREQK